MSVRRLVAPLLLGLLVAGPPAAAREAPSPEPTPAAIDAAIGKAVAWLREEQKPDGGWGGGSLGLGHAALGALALLHAGLREDGPTRDDRSLTIALRVLDRDGPGRPKAKDLDPGTYSTALVLLALRARGRDADRPRLQRLADLLCRTQAANGQWSYAGEPGDSGRGGPAVGDNSNSQFAVLALAASVGEGLDVAPGTLRKARDWWRSAAQEDGGFGYSSGGSSHSESTGSMTAAGIACLAALDAAIGETSAPSSDAIRRATDRLAREFSVERNFGPAVGGAKERPRNAGRGWLHYYLWALERAVVLAETDRLAGQDVYEEGVRRLLQTQADDGSWRSENPFYATCFGVLFLTRAADPARAFTKPPTSAPTTPGETPAAPIALPPGGPDDWLRGAVLPLDLRAACLRFGPASLPPLVRALDDPDAKVRRRAFEALTGLLGPERVEGADRHPLRRGRLALWVRRNLRFLTASGERFVLP
jgi:hypothetical protein